MSGQGSAPSDADKIRLARLARLGGSSTPARTERPSSPQGSVPIESPAPARAPPSAASRLLSSQASSSSPSPIPISNKPTSSSSPAVSKSPSSFTSVSLGKRRVSPSASAAKEIEPTAPKVVSTPVSNNQPKIAYSKWETQAITSIFSATLDKEGARQSDWRLCWLKSLQEELDEESPSAPRPHATTADLVDRILVARLSLDHESLAASNDPDSLTVLAGLPQDETIFEYLTGCWKRLYNSNRELNRVSYSTEEKSKWQELFNKLRSLIISYCGMTLEDPTMFPQPQGRPTGPAEFLPILLSLTPSGNNTSSGDPLTASSKQSNITASTCLGPSDLLPFLNDLAAGTQDVLSDVLSPTFSLFFQQWFSITPTPDILGEDWRRYLGAVATLVQVKAIAALLPTLSVWVAPDVNAPKLEWQSLLGPLTRLSVYPREFAEVWKAYFSNPADRTKEDIEANKSNLRHTLGALQTSLFNIYNSIVRASPDSREGVLEFFALVIKLNEKRAGMRVDPRLVSSDGYMSNLQIVLLKLFEPVMDVSFSKIDKIDPDYYTNSSRLDITEETRIKAAKEDIDSYKMDVDAKSTPNFVSDLFFLLNAFQHLGLVKTIGNRTRAEKNISEIEKELKRTEAARGDWTGNPAMETQGEAAITKLKSDVAVLRASVHAYDAQLLDPALIRLNVNFISFLMTWLVRLVDPKHQHPAVPLSLPLPAEAPMQFRLLPEYLIENVSEYLEFLSRHEHDPLETPDKDILITFVIVFLSPGYINNPFLKAKLVAILSNGLYPGGYYRKGTLYDRLTISPLSTEHLMPTLIRFFIDVEMTGGHTQFWDKFNFRRDISHIIRSLWDNPLHREAFVQSRHNDFDQFIKFINMLMSDTTFHLEESLTNLVKINSIRAQQAERDAWNALPQNEREDLTSQMAQAEQGAPFHTQMGLDHVELIRDFTATTKEPFVTGEIVDRLAASLDENLTNLVGPKMQELRVSDPEKFGFKPKRLLAAIAQIYLNLSQESDFIRAVANDGRSYTKELFEKFARILKHRGIMTEGEVAEVIAFTQKVEDMKATIVIEDERDIPDEFLDPLLATLMKDPVILPVSRVVIDRATIRTHLLSKEADPFNNVPLKLEDCVPDTELKAKIDAWIAEGGNQQAGDVMDVDNL